MFEQRLMERAMAGDAVPRSRPDPSAVLADVLAHLRDLFNVRQGAVPTRPDYGMPDISGLLDQFPDAIGVLRGAIARQIERFEPRLAAPVVRHAPDPENPLVLTYSITAELVLGNRRERVTFATAIGDDGQVRLLG